MSEVSEFLSNNNKAMLWQILTEQNAFANIPNEYFTRVRQLYESTLQQVSEMKQYNLTDKNKLILMEMSKKLPFLKQTDMTRPLEEVKIKLNQDFNTKQTEYMQLVNHNKPAEPEFTDKEDTPLELTDMNNMLNNMMEMREKELSQINPNKKEIEDLINKKPQFSNSEHNGSCTDYMLSQFGDNINDKNDNSNSNSNRNDNSNSNRNRNNINDNSNSNRNDNSNRNNNRNDINDNSSKLQDNSNKHVSFGADDFLSKLKFKQTSDGSDITKKILDNQLEIIMKLDLILAQK